MLVRAKESFAGEVSMHRGQELEIAQGEVLDDLLQAGFVEEIKPTKEVKKNEGK